MNITFKKEFSFPKLLSIKGQTLRFDFAVFDKENKLVCLIECQGQQHYKPIEQFGGEAQFLIQKENDEKKRNFCKEENIILIEIPYWDYPIINESYLKEKFLINNCKMEEN